jgi:hypothetical protein
VKLGSATLYDENKTLADCGVKENSYIDVVSSTSITSIRDALRTEIGPTVGGKKGQTILPDSRHYRAWDVRRGARLFVHLGKDLLFPLPSYTSPTITHFLTCTPSRFQPHSPFFFFSFLVVNTDTFQKLMGQSLSRPPIYRLAYELSKIPWKKEYAENPNAEPDVATVGAVRPVQRETYDYKRFVF